VAVAVAVARSGGRLNERPGVRTPLPADPPRERTEEALEEERLFLATARGRALKEPPLRAEDFALPLDYPSAASQTFAGVNAFAGDAHADVHAA